MKAVRFHLHPTTPEQRKLVRIAEALRHSAIVLYPTDTGFALGCQLGDRDAIERLRLIRRLPHGKPLTFLCASLKHIADFAYVTTNAYRILRRLVPGPYTFILPATKAVPHYAQDLRRRTAGIRVPNHTVSLALLETLGAPIISISALSEEEQNIAPEELIERMSTQVDLIVEAEPYEFVGPSTVIDMTQEPFRIVRRGAGLDYALEVLPDDVELA